MNANTAQAIAELINDRNKLTVLYTAEKVLKEAGNYLCRFETDARLLGVVEVKRVQWYQCEIEFLGLLFSTVGCLCHS